MAIKIFLSQIDSSLPKADIDDNSYMSDRGSVGSSPDKDSHGNMSNRSDNASKDVTLTKKDETTVNIEPNNLFDKHLANICENFIDYSKKKGQELPSNDHIKKWIDKPDGHELRRAIHDTLACLVREAKFDHYQPDAIIDKKVLIDILNLSNKCEWTISELLN